jgi:hypothetical protein
MRHSNSTVPFPGALFSGRTRRTHTSVDTVEVDAATGEGLPDTGGGFVRETIGGAGAVGVEDGVGTPTGVDVGGMPGSIVAASTDVPSPWGVPVVRGP